MNIFVTDKCPIRSAQYLDDKRVVKMCLESAQLLASAIQLNGGTATYKITHKGHPATIWTAKTKGNYRWVLRHFAALCREYTRRYGKVHKCTEYIKEFTNGINYIPDGGQEKFVNCAANKEHGVSFKHLDDTCLAYQLYLNERWDKDKREPTWS